MATMLSSRYSAERCLNFTHRHQRLCKQVVNDENLVNQIQPAQEEIISKTGLLAKKQNERENAYDDLILSDRTLDDVIRSIFEDCKQHNRENPAELVLTKIFPDEKFGEIVRLPFTREINEAGKIILRLESLGNEHALNPYI